jgi:hypothetical protein
LWLFRILHERNIHNPLPIAIINIYDNNEIKIKVVAILIKTITISKGVQQGCHLLPALFNICINHIITEWKDEKIKNENFKK